VSEKKEANAELSSLNRRQFMRGSLIASAGALAANAFAQIGAGTSSVVPAVKPFELDEVTIADLQSGMKSGRFSARSLTQKYLARVDEIDEHGPTVNSVIEVNRDALAIAEALDQERKAKGPRGPLHGIPVLIKDNIGTADRMMTTAGSLALLGSIAAKDSFVAQQLRKAGAVILGKTNLSEWANIRSSHSTSGWSGRGGQTRNPYVLDRNPCGSSSGSGAAVSANLCAVAVGTETDGSIVCPSSANGIVGIKPTLGLVSRSGIIPIAHSQDTAGPMARTVTDAAILLTALMGMDSQDSATADSRGKASSDYTQFLDPKGLQGKKIGVLRKLFGFSDAVDDLMTAAIAAMKQAGATIVDPVDIDGIGKMDDPELEVLLTELKADLNNYLAALGSKAAVKSLQDVIEFNDRNKQKEMPFFGQDLFIKAQAKGAVTGKEYLDALAKNRRMAREDGIDAVIAKHQLDAIIAPTGGPAWLNDSITGDHFSGGSSQLPAIAGYPNIQVPAGHVFGLPVGISFFAGAYSEPKLIAIAYAYEQATKFRRAPQFLPTLAAV
jgi:amidase